MRQPINIIASCDDKYSQHVGVVYESIIRNTSAVERLHLYLIDSGISESNKTKLRKTVEAEAAQLTFLTPTDSIFDGMPRGRYGLSSLQRLALGRYLPADVEKVIYLDSDIIVLDDIAVLWDCDMEGKPLAAIENLSPKACKKMGFDRQDYFNAGILMIDVTYWREQDVLSRTLAYIAEHKDVITFMDQCALNSIYSGNWKKLPLKWNLQADVFGVIKKYSDGCGYSPEDLLAATKRPGIVHFIGRQKPWLWDCFNPYKVFYDAYLRKSQWSGSRPADDSPKNRYRHYLSLRKKLKQCRLFHGFPEELKNKARI